MMRKYARIVLKLGRKIRDLTKKLLVFGEKYIDNSVEISWSARIDLGGGQLKIGAHTAVDHGVIIRAYGGVVEIGEYCSLNPYCVLIGFGGVKIGTGVRIADHVTIVASNHRFNDTTKFIYMQPVSGKGIVIEDDVWIGSGVRILDGVTVGQGSVIGAGAVVSRSIPPYSIAVGVPARRVGSRNQPKD